MKQLIIDITRIFSFFLAFTPFIAQADPGHGPEGISGWSLLHFILAPKHAFLLGVLIIMTILFIFRAKIKKSITTKKDHVE